MAGLIYILDTNAITDRINGQIAVTRRLTQVGQARNILGLCWPVHYEVLRGLLKVNATAKMQVFTEKLIPLLDAIDMEPADWLQAARWWADMRNRGRQLSDIDLLVAAIAKRLGGIVVSADTDFDALGIQREDWRQP